MSMISLTHIHDGGVVMMVLGTLVMVGHLGGIALWTARRRLVERQPLGRRFAEVN
jgi:hypothetical protein